MGVIYKIKSNLLLAPLMSQISGAVGVGPGVTFKPSSYIVVEYQSFDHSALD